MTFDTFTLEPKRSEADRLALRMFAMQTRDHDQRDKILAYLDQFSTPEEKAIGGYSMAVLWCAWHDAEVRFQWHLARVEVIVPIYDKPPGYLRRAVRYEAETAENLVDAVHRLAKRLKIVDPVDLNLEALAKRGVT